jgi:tetratricopeptide (TPR) repeat protein/energy-coupling factor transporter ATP-binding protein EcfA2
MSITSDFAPALYGGPDDLSEDRPFLGLKPFGFIDRAIFFGRELQILALYRLIQQSRFVAVVGSSGSGKSSLVLAGLCGLLAEETAQDPSGHSWCCVDMRPGVAPLSRLARALSHLSSDEDAVERRLERIEYRLRKSSFSMESALEEAGGLRGRTLLLIVDQFEELFRFGLSDLGRPHRRVEEVRAREEATQFVQILLDADRRQLENVRVLITMRSDFIGDCAHFQDLSVAVSAAQFLVPNLTRSQLKDIIRRPIDKAGGSIEPELVEQLLIDCGAELDQLPVLQHCLTRLWERAGTEDPAGLRRLTLQTYDDIGRMAEALSRHADEALQQCAGSEIAVQQVFRALSELDSEGRAVQRPLRFEKLQAETGVSEGALQTVLEKFSAPGCSFLVPARLTAWTLAPDDIVGIGHEALLRRWKKLAGDPSSVDPATGRPVEGWLAAEQVDGQRYRTLVSMLDGQGNRPFATLNNPESVKVWWSSLPRTSAWADRYGGKFDAVRRLIERLAARKLRAKFISRSLMIAGTLVFAGALLGWQYNQVRKRQEEATQEAALSSVNLMMAKILAEGQSRTLSVDSARTITAAAESLFRNLREPVTADALVVSSLLLQSDLEAVADNPSKQLELATEAKSIAERLALLNPQNREYQQKLFDATIRQGDALVAQLKLAAALSQYLSALTVAEKISSFGDGETGLGAVVDAHLKIGDIYSLQNHQPAAIKEYRAALAVTEATPSQLDLQRYRATALYRIAYTLQAEGASDEVRQAYEQTIQLQELLVRQNPTDEILQSNLATTYSRLGLLERKAGNLELARVQYEKAVAISDKLIEIDRDNSSWETFAIPQYNSLAEILEALNKPKEALVYYQKAFDASRALSLQSPTRPELLEQLAAAGKALGDHSSGLARLEAYRTSTLALNRLFSMTHEAARAAKYADDVLAYARGFETVADWPDAEIAYGLAEKMAQTRLADDPSDETWTQKANEASRGAQAVARALVSPPDQTTRPSPPN